MRESQLYEILTCTDVNQAAELLVHKLNTILDIMAPIKTVHIRTNYVPGLGDDTKKLQKERDDAHAKAVTSDSPEDWREYRAHRNQATAKSRSDKKNWEREKLDHSKNNPTDTWKTVKGWLGWGNTGPPTQLFTEGRMVSGPTKIANAMNNF